MTLRGGIIFNIIMRAKESEAGIDWIAAFQIQLTNGGKDIIVQSNSYQHRQAVTPALIKHIY